MRRTAFAVPFIALTLAAASPSHAQIVPCPTSDVQLYFAVASYPTAALDTSYVVGSFGTYRASFDLVSGALHIEKPITSNFGYEYVTARDAYDLQGLPAGTVVPLTAHFSVNGYVESGLGCGGSGCSGFFGASLYQGATQVANQSVSVGFTGRSDLVQTLGFPFSLTVGQPVALGFQLYYFVQAGGDGYGGIGDGSLYFTGLPAGAKLVSCHGYSNLPTPTRTVSWGKLKTIYR